MQRFQAFHDLLLLGAGTFLEELDRLIHGHFQHIVYVSALILYIQYILLEAFAVASLAFQGDIRHKLHLYRDLALALTFLTATSFFIKGKISGVISHLLRKRLLTE